jgi:putative MFS transporter
MTENENEGTEKMLHNKTYFIICILAIGYMIDFFDLTIFAVVRVPALQSLGVKSEDFLTVSSLMFNAQAIGVVCGGVLSGIWGDKFGRMSAVRAGILLYSLAILANAFVTSVPLFAVMRFLAGVGLAGEFAASVTLLSELLQSEKRGFASAAVYASGVFGGLLATVIGSLFDWQIIFIVGGVAGLVLLLIRFSIKDSILFQTVKNKKYIVRGSLKFLLFHRESFLKLIALTLLIIPFWFMAFFVNFSQEVAKNIGIKGEINQSISLSVYLLGSLFGAYLFPFIARLIASRKIAIFSSLLLMFFSIGLFAVVSNTFSFYFIFFLIGMASGFPGLFMVMSAESFGTNQRSLASSLIINLGRCSLVFMNAFVPWMGTLFAPNAHWIGFFLAASIFLVLGVCALMYLKETNNRSLDFYEGDFSEDQLKRV